MYQFQLGTYQKGIPISSGPVDPHSALFFVDESLIDYLQTNNHRRCRNKETIPSPKRTAEETASPLQWSRGGLVGRITGGGEGDARVMSVTDRAWQSSSPSSSSEQLDSASSSLPHKLV